MKLLNRLKNCNMLLYYTKYLDGDGNEQIYEVADDPSKLSKKIRDCYSDQFYKPTVCTYDTKCKTPLR